MSEGSGSRASAVGPAPGAPVECGEPTRRGGAWWAFALCLAAVTFCASTRILATLNHPSFDREDASSLLRSDPGLLYYVTERILEAEGGVPEDFHADPNVQHPDRVDLARMFTVGQEFLVAWAYRAFGGEMPLHVFCVVFFSILAALTTLGVFGATYELTGRPGWAALAAVFYVGIPVNYRTTGFILIREDLSLPLLALHLWSLARLARRPSPAMAVVSGLLLTAALATWHAMGFVVALELAAVSTWAVASGRNPFGVRSAWILSATVVATSLAVPVLRSKLFLLSIPVALAGALALAHLVESRLPRPSSLLRRAGTWGLALVGLAGTTAGAARAWLPGAADYGHVVALIAAKLAHLGQIPADPGELPFDVRLLWQGPFNTAQRADLVFGMPQVLLGAGFAFACGLLLLRRARLDDGLAVTLAFLALGLVSGLLIRRTLVVPGLLAPIAAAVACARLGLLRTGAWSLSTLGVAGGAFVAYGLTHAPLPWYEPPQRAAELRSLVRWVDENLPPDGAILGDFVASTSILAYSRNPIALQPKYETAETRRRIQELYETFATGTPEDLRALARRLECDYVLVDTETLWWSGRYILGVPYAKQVPDKGTCAWFFVNRNPAALTGVPGFELLYRSPPELQMDLFRVYRVR